MDRPDLLVRVFRMKFLELMDDLTKKHVLGQCIGYAYAIEFQKRMLPHVHILLILHPDYRPRNGGDCDRIASAEIPG